MIIRNVTQHSDFARWLYRVCEMIKHLFLDTDELRITIFCKSGKHRSVATALILDELARRSGLFCKAIHLNNWPLAHMRGCSKCQCKSPADADLKRRAIDDAFNFWINFMRQLVIEPLQQQKEILQQQLATIDTDGPRRHVREVPWTSTSAEHLGDVSQLAVVDQ